MAIVTFFVNIFWILYYENVLAVFNENLLETSEELYVYYETLDLKIAKIKLKLKMSLKY